jgi:hypothetical protein
MDVRPQSARASGAAAIDHPRASAGDAVRRFGPVLAGYALPFLLVFYLAMKGGGYDSIVRGEVGVAVWWVVLIGAAVGALPAARITAAGWVMFGLLAAFAVWTTLGISWSDSAERSAAEAGRVAAYLGVFVLALTAQRGEAVRRTVVSVGGAIAVVSVLALLSRVHPDWFPANTAADVLPQGRRLNYPLGYWNGLAALSGIGIPVILWVATSGRHVVSRALAAAALPAMAVATYYTLSRGGAIEIAAGLIVLFALYPRRLQLLPMTLIAGTGSALAVAAASQRGALADGLTNAAADSQGSEMLAVVLVTCAGVGLVAAAIALAERHQLYRMPSVPRPAALGAGAAVAIVCLIGALAFGAPGKIADGWESFKDPGGPNDTAQRFSSAGGNGRYQYWSTLVDAGEDKPLTGIGPGTFEFLWARDGTRTGFVRDGHSLYFESLGELGFPGALLIIALMIAVLGWGVVQCRGADPARRTMLAAATAGCTVFAVAAGIDWVWELPVIPVCFLLLAASIAATRATAPKAGGRRGGLRLGIVGLSLAGLIAVAIPLASAASIRDSQNLVRSAQLGQALDAAATAKSIQPYAATPNLQEALIYEQAGDLKSAVASAHEATDDEPTNWRNWIVLSRLEARNGNADGAIAAYRHARDLNPRSPLFN